MMSLLDTNYKIFYDQRRQHNYGHDYDEFSANDHSFFSVLQSFITQYALTDKKCLEIGSSGGFFQDMVEDYTGTDIAESLAGYYHKPYRVTTGTKYPFEDERFDAIWTITVHEHIPYLQEALLEIRRLLKPGGVVLFAPAWQCRSWAAEGYDVRFFCELDFKGKLIKSSIPLRNSVFWRSMFLVPKRIVRHLSFLLGRRVESVQYRRIKANYTTYWGADSDACNQIDPHDAILWFESHGFVCLSHPLHIKALLVRNGALVFRKLLTAD